MRKAEREGNRDREIEVERQRLEGNGTLKLVLKKKLHLPHKLQRDAVHWKSKVHL